MITMLECPQWSDLPIGISGHKNLKQMQSSIQAADRLGLACEAFKKQTTAGTSRTKIVKLGAED
jgi:hypothetical protein